MKIKLPVRMLFLSCFVIQCVVKHAPAKTSDGVTSPENAAKKTVAVLLFNNQADSTINNDYNIPFDYPAKFIVTSLNSNNKINVLPDDATFRFSNNPDTIAKLFDLLHADAIVTGNISAEGAYRRLVVKTKIFLIEKKENVATVIDSVSLPRQKNGYYFTDTLKKAIAADVQGFFNAAITINGQWDPALFNYQDISANEIFTRGKEMINANNLSFAKALAQKIIMQKKDSTWLGFQLAGIIELKRNNYDAAIIFFDRALKLNIYDLESNEQKGNTFFNKGLYPEALVEFKKCSGDDKKFPGIHYKMALCYFQLENDSIIMSANLALKSAVDSAEIYDLLGRYFLDVKKSSYDSAIYYFHNAVQQDTSKNYIDNLNSAYYQEASQLMGQNKLWESLPFIKNIFKSDSTAETLDIIRWVFTELGQYDSVDYYIGIGFNSEIYYLEDVFFSQGEYCLSASNTNNSELSKKHLMKVFYYLNKDAEVNGEIFRILETKGTAYSYLNNNDSAIYFYNKAIAAYSFKLYTYLNLAELQLLNNKPDSALLTVKKGLDHIYEWPAEKSKLSPEEEVLARFLIIVSKIILNKNFNVELREEEKLLDPFRDLSDSEKQFITGWSFKSFQKWMESTSLEQKVKNKINDQLNYLKEFTDPELLLN